MSEQFIPKGYVEMRATHLATEELMSPRMELKSRDPKLLNSLDDVVGGLREGLIPEQLCSALVDAMPDATRRRMVQKSAGLDATVIMSLKTMLGRVDAVLSRVVSEDGTPAGRDEDLPISVKDALNMAIRVSQVITKDLPKVYQVDRLQRREEALALVMEKHMTPEQQDALLEELEKLEGSVVE
jgi:hypothetical protein